MPYVFIPKEVKLLSWRAYSDMPLYVSITRLSGLLRRGAENSVCRSRRRKYTYVRSVDRHVTHTAYVLLRDEALVAQEPGSAQRPCRCRWALQSIVHAGRALRQTR